MRNLIFLILSSLLIILIISLSSINIYAEDKDYDVTRISITLEERKELSPDILNMTLTINVIATKEAEVINILGSIDKSIRSFNLKYSGGSYSVYKNCWWEKDRRKCHGYKGDMSYSFELKEAKEQNKILEAMDSFKEQFVEKMNYTVSNPQWLISEKKAKAEENELKIQVIDSAKEFAKKASEKLSKICSITSINYDVRRPYLWESPVLMKSAPVMEKAVIEAPEPKKEEKSLSVRATVGFICR